MPPDANNQQPQVPGAAPAMPVAQPPQQPPPGQAMPDNVIVPRAPGAPQPLAGGQPAVGSVANPSDALPLNPGKSNPNSTQNSLLISEIRDGIMIMNDGTFRAVIYTKSINFDLMSPMEREGVEAAYQGFINSLYFQVQIYIRSQ